MILVTIPTYQEKENLISLIPEILKLGPEYQVLVIDDFSDDGTKEVVLNLIHTTNRVHFIERKGVRGRGLAGRDGFIYALQKGAEKIVEMDADFSHRPQDIPLLVSATEQADIAVGSRYIPGAQMERGFVRNLISAFSSWIVRKVTGVPIKDPTSGFRCYRKEVIATIFEKSPLISRSPSIVQEVEYKANLLGFTFKEVPIIFEDRKKGKSTFNFKVVRNVLRFLFMMPFLFGYLRDTKKDIIEIYSPENIEKKSQ
jgi:dolichol-phosphate mannosyltransferase